MSNDMSQNNWGSTIPYDALVKDALKKVAIDVLSDAAENGLRGDHHFYIAFYTQHPRVSIPKHLMQKYPEEMTIVVQHRFWGLKIHDDYFEIGLSFNQRPERLVVPFEAIIGFVDPSVHFALQFDNDSGANEDEDDDGMMEDMAADAQLAKSEKTDTSDDNEDNKVVTLDAFRKKS